MKQYLRFLPILALCAACHKNDHPGAPLSRDSHLQVTINISLGTITNGRSADTFLVNLNDPSTVYQVPLLLHVASTSKVPGKTRFDDSTFYDTVDISANKVAPVTVIAANGDSTNYGIAIPYALTHYSFNNFNNGLSTQAPSPVLTVFVSGDTIYAGTYGGLCVSTNGGAGFTTYTAANGLGDDQVNGVTAVGATIYASTRGGLSISTDGGSHFTNRTTADGLGDNNVCGVALQGSILYAATVQGVSVSADGGTTFKNYGKSAGLAAYPVLGIAVASNNLLYAATAGGLSISADSGATFNNFTTSNGLGNDQVNNVFTAGSQVFASTLTGLSYSNNGQIFTTYEAGLPNLDVHSAFYDGNSLFVGTGGGLGISIGNGTIFDNYNEVNGLGGNTVWSVFERGGTIYAGTNADLTVLTPR